VLPAGIESRISAVEIAGREVDHAYAPQSVVLHLEDDIDISRGDLIVHSENLPQVSQELEVLLCWMDNKPLAPGKKYLLQINSRVVRAVVKSIDYKLDVNTLQKDYSAEQAQLNDIIKATIKTASPIPYDSYKKHRENGGAILIDENSNVTVGAGMIL
jgi:sulfate adenylyltransferase subunit 1